MVTNKASLVMLRNVKRSFSRFLSIPCHAEEPKRSFPAFLASLIMLRNEASLIIANHDLSICLAYLLDNFPLDEVVASSEQLLRVYAQ